MTDVSVLLPVRNWDLVRVDACIRSVLRSEGIKTEVVLIDYGSDDAQGIADLAKQHACTFMRVEAEVWSRSHAMNTAAEISSGRYLVFADADFVYAPSTIAATVKLLEADQNSVVAFQVRDLPSQISPESLLEEIDFQYLDAGATWRPRWGMGAQALPKRIFDEIRGFDNRMKVYGGEDNDIAKRTRAHGYRITWVPAEEFAIYHMWHPSSRVAADSSPETKEELQKNVDIAKNDVSIVRNLEGWKSSAPLVSVVITTHNRAEYIAESIKSVLNQTVQDFEILVYDDGSTDKTEEVVRSIDDARIRYFKEPKSGIPTLRNKALDESRGRFTAIHDDDDLMLPWSLESRLRSVSAGVLGAYGGAYDFDNETGDMTLFNGRLSEHATVLNGGKVSYHATLLVQTDALRAVKYDESFQSGSDYNLSLRLLKSGVNMVHCGDVVLLRRLHRRQVTATDQAVQHGASYATTFAHRAAWGANSRWKSRERSKEVAPWNYASQISKPERFYRYLPNHLVERASLQEVELERSSTAHGIEGTVLADGISTRVRFSPAAELPALTGEDREPNCVDHVYVAPKDDSKDLAELFLKTVSSAFEGATFAMINPHYVGNGFEIVLEGQSFIACGERSSNEKKCILLMVPTDATPDSLMSESFDIADNNSDA